MKNSKIPFVKCSDLSTQSFCEYQLLLEYEGYEPIESEAREKGIAKHEELYEEFEKNANIKASFKNFLLSGELMGREVIVGAPLNKKVWIVGRVDELKTFSERIEVIDYKPKNFVRIGWIREVNAYGYIIDYWLKKFKIKKNVYTAIANENTKETIWFEKFSKEKAKDVRESALRIWKILNGKEKPIPTTKISKCINCKFRHECKHYEKIEKLRKDVIELKEKGFSERKIAEKFHLSRWKVRRLLGKTK